ncbi:MAG TPA: phage tail tube protein [Candidatus Wunengus sp. YC60]|uniref:phage tail tube protein n=1 Tax=Candidatus Wunengus sp. YC60 TaxID=3367697 RepID=UPI004024BFEC
MPGNLLRTKAVILAKLETTYGVDLTPTAGSNAILCELPEFEVIEKTLERNNTRTYYGNDVPINVGEGLKITFTTEAKGSGTAGTAPEIGPLFQACNFTETVIPVTSVMYGLNSKNTDGKSVTIYFYQHDILHKIKGCRGKVSLDLKAGEYGKFKWEFTGLPATPVDSSIVTGIYNATLPPVLKSGGFSIDSYAGVIDTFKLSIDNKVSKRPSANAPAGILEYFISGRKVSGEIDPETPTLATKDFWAKWENSDQMDMQISLGATAGNIMYIESPYTVLKAPKYGEREGLLIYSLGFKSIPSQGNDELIIMFT